MYSKGMSFHIYIFKRVFICNKIEDKGWERARGLWMNLHMQRRTTNLLRILTIFVCVFFFLILHIFNFHIIYINVYIFSLDISTRASSSKWTIFFICFFIYIYLISFFFFILIKIFSYIFLSFSLSVKTMKYITHITRNTNDFVC